jgi:hypothetical protein
MKARTRILLGVAAVLALLAAMPPVNLADERNPPRVTIPMALSAESPVPQLILPPRPIRIEPPAPTERAWVKTAAPVNQFRLLPAKTVHPMMVLPAGASLYWESGEFRLFTDREVDPQAKDQRLWFNYDVSKVPRAGAVIWQISRVLYRTGPTDPMEMKPHGVVLSGTADGARGAFTVDFKALAEEEGIAVGPAREAPAKPTIRGPVKTEPAPGSEGGARLAPLLKLVPLLTEEVPALGRAPGFTPAPPGESGGAKTVAPITPQALTVKLGEFYKLAGGVPLFVRIIPVATERSEVAVGRPSNVVTAYYGRRPQGAPLELNANPPPPKPAERLLKVDSFEYHPHVTYCRAHSNTSYCGQFKGGNKDFFEEAGDFFTGVWDWAANTYQAAKSAVVSVAAKALPMVPQSVLETALDSALVAAGIPPDIPNLDAVLDGGADYLAGEIVDQVGPPVASDFAREKIKEALVAGAKKAAQAKIGNAGPDTPCDYVTDAAYVIFTLHNISGADLRDVRLTLINGNWNGVFDQVYKKFDVLPRGSTQLVVLGLPHSMRAEFCDGQLYSEGKWWEKYATVKSNFNLSAQMTRGKDGFNQGVFATPDLDLTKPYHGGG